MQQSVCSHSGMYMHVCESQTSCSTHVECIDCTAEEPFDALFIKIAQSVYSGKYSFVTEITQEDALAFHQQVDPDLRHLAQSELANVTPTTTASTGKLFPQNPCDYGCVFAGVRKGGTASTYS